DFLGPLDIAQFWYSTGLSTDGTKLPLPITVSYDAAEEEPAPTPTEEPTTPETVNETTAPPPVTTPQYPGLVLPNPAPIVPAGHGADVAARGAGCLGRAGPPAHRRRPVCGRAGGCPNGRRRS